MSRKRRLTKDPDLAQVPKALRRAALQARRIARVTDTPLVIYKDGRVIKKKV
jgi:hypothetical protein